MQKIQDFLFGHKESEYLINFLNLLYYLVVDCVSEQSNILCLMTKKGSLNGFLYFSNVAFVGIAVE